MKRPPGPDGLPFIGSLLRARRDPLRFARDVTRAYGDIAYFRIGIYTGYLLNHPDHFRHVLQSNLRNYSKENYNYKKLKPVLGEGLITAEGDSWLRSRRLIQPVFHRKRIARVGSIITQAATGMLDHWAAIVDRDRTINLNTAMMRLTLRIIFRALFSMNIGTEANQVLHSFTRLNEDIAQRFRAVFVPPPGIPTPRNRKFKRERDNLDRVVYEIIHRRRADGNSHDDLLETLLSARDESSGQRMTDRQIRDEVMTLMLAGHETTANLLTWTCYLLTRHPSVVKKLRTELRTVLGGHEPTADDLSELQYTKQVLQESMRLYPPVWIISRQAKNEDTIAGYPIPAGSTVTMCTYTIHRHPEFWEHPDAFRPERFDPGRSEHQSPEAYFPFGAGPRFCIGNNLAIMEGQMILACIYQRYGLRLVPGHRVEPEPLVTLRPREGLHVTVHSPEIRHEPH